jgi:hypothetical protein
MMRSLPLLLLGCLVVAACGSTTQPSDTATSSAGGKTRDVEFSECMRSHGVPEFPDPAFSSPHAPRVLIMRGMVFVIPASVDPKSPAFQRAAHACGFGGR